MIMKSHNVSLLSQTKLAAFATLMMAGLTVSPLVTAQEAVATIQAVSEGRMMKGQLDGFSNEDKHKQIEKKKNISEYASKTFSNEAIGDQFNIIYHSILKLDAK